MRKFNLHEDTVLVFLLTLGTHLQISIWSAEVGRLPQVEGQPGLHCEMHAPLHSLKNKNEKSVSIQVPLDEILRKRPTDGIARFLKATADTLLNSNFRKSAF